MDLKTSFMKPNSGTGFRACLALTILTSWENPLKYLPERACPRAEWPRSWVSSVRVAPPTPSVLSGACARSCCAAARRDSPPAASSAVQQKNITVYGSESGSVTFWRIRILRTFFNSTLQIPILLSFGSGFQDANRFFLLTSWYYSYIF